MARSYKHWEGLESHPLGNAALKLREAYGGSCQVSPLIAMSDPKRTPHYLDWAKSLPEGCALIYRFDKFDAHTAQSLSDIAKKKNQQLLIRDETLHPQSDGMHLKRDTSLGKIRTLKNKDPKALLTLAALKNESYKEPLPAIDALLVSAIFKSKSPSAGEPIGVEGLRHAVQKYAIPVFALGGINTSTVKSLEGSGIAGIAAIGGLKKENIMSKDNLVISKKIDGDTITFNARYSGDDLSAELNLSKVKDGVYNAHHTGVPKAMGGKGVGTALVKAMSEDAHENNYKIIPGCPFVAVWFKRKPAWAEMAALEPEKFRR